MTDAPITAKTLMPKWWQIGSTALLYAAYLLWLIPVVLYFWRDAGALMAGIWLAGVVIVQFVLVKAIALVEYISTANELERLSAEDDYDPAPFGEK